MDKKDEDKVNRYYPAWIIKHGSHKLILHTEEYSHGEIKMLKCLQCKRKDSRFNEAVLIPSDQIIGAGK